MRAPLFHHTKAQSNKAKVTYQPTILQCSINQSEMAALPQMEKPSSPVVSLHPAHTLKDSPLLNAPQIYTECAICFPAGAFRIKAFLSCNSKEEERQQSENPYLRGPSPSPPCEAARNSLRLNHTGAIHGLQGSEELTPTFHL